MITASIIIGVSIFIASLYIRGGLITLAMSNHAVAKQIHIHAETLNEIKHEGIGIDNDPNLTPGEKFLRKNK